MSFKSSVNWKNFAISLSSFEASSFRCCIYSSNSITLWSSEAKIEVLFSNLTPLSEVVSTSNLLGSTFFLWNCWFILDSFCIKERHKSAVFWYLFLCSTRQSTPLFKHSTFSRQNVRNSCKPVCVHKAEKEVCEVNSRLDLTWILRFSQGDESRFHLLTFKSSTSWSKWPCDQQSSQSSSSWSLQKYRSSLSCLWQRRSWFVRCSRSLNPYGGGTFSANICNIKDNQVRKLGMISTLTEDRISCESQGFQHKLTMTYPSLLSTFQQVEL